MSLFTRAKFVRPKLTRSIISNPAINSNPAFRNPAIVPFGINFVDDELRAQLNSRQVDVDDLESLYYKQCQNDAEFNASKLPNSYDSKLWGFIYGERLVSAKHKLDTIKEDELFLRNYLNETIKELSMRMDRFYPNFDYKSQVKAANVNNNDNEAYNASYNEALSEIISSEAGTQRFVNIFKNNSFLNDSDNESNDFLPENVENELISSYQYKWDVNSQLDTGFDSYFEKISKMEQILSPKIDSLSSHLRKNVVEFFLDSFAQNNLKYVEDIINLVEKSTGSVISKLNETENGNINTLNLLNQMQNETEIEVNLGSLLYASKELKNIKLSESILDGVDAERLVLINKFLQIYEYLKYNSLTRLVLSCLINEFSPYFATFLNSYNGLENISSFESLNNDILDEIVSLKTIHNENGDDLLNAFNSLMKRIGDEVGVSDILSQISFERCSFEAPPCFIAAIVESSLNSAQSNGDILGEIKYLTLYKYLTQNSSKMSLVQLVRFLMNPSRSELSSTLLKNMASHFTDNASEATDILLNQVSDFMKNNGLTELDSNSLQAFKTDLTSSLQNEFDNFRNMCNEYNNSRNNLEKSIQKITLNFETINFDQVQSVYDPLSTYLAQFKYYNSR